AHTLAERLRGAPKGPRDAQTAPTRSPHQLALGSHPLVVNSPQHIADRTRVIVLNEVDLRADRLRERPRIEALEERATRVREHVRFEYKHAVKGRSLDFHVP